MLIVQDVPKAARFYRKVVGLAPRTEPDDRWAWFFAGEQGKNQLIGLHKGTLLFEEKGSPPKGNGPRWGPIHFALEVPRNQLDTALAHVRSHQIDVYGPIDFDWMNAKSYYFYDLDGNLVEFWSPDPDA